MNTVLQSVAAYSAQDNLLILSDKDNLAWSSAFFGEAESKFIANMAANDTRYLAMPNGDRMIYIQFLSTHNNENARREEMRCAGAARLQTFKHYHSKSVVLINYAAHNYAAEVAEGIVLGNYQYTVLLSDPKKAASSFETLSVLETAIAPAELDKQRNLYWAVCKTRDLINAPLSHLNALQLSNEFEKMGADAGFSVKVLHKAEIEALGMGGLLGVNRGSQCPPTFNVLEWKPAHAKNSRPIVLVGKGLTYDTGGLSLKPTPDSMDYMKCDMSGAATVAAMLYVAAKNNMPLHLIALTPCTDNRPGEDAFVPGDVLKMMSGTTVEVMNTDAEGRLVLADALHYAKQYDPELVLEFSTLTGATARALGTQAAGIFSTASRELTNKAIESGFNVHERVVEFPMWDDYNDMLKSDIADYKNIGGPSAGGITAAKFLEHFTGGYPFMHFDIAGCAFLHKQEGYRVRGGVAWGVRLLNDFLNNL